MTYTLTGENGFLLNRELVRLTAAFVEKYGSHELERLDGENAGLADVKSKLQSLPFLSEKKCVVILEPGKINGFKEDIKAILETSNESMVVILVEPKLDKRTAYARTLQKQTEYKQFNDLDEESLARWLVESAQQQQATLQKTDAHYLIRRVGTNQYLLFNELEKLISYNAAITRDSIDLLTEAAPQSTIFELIDAAFSGRLKQALQLYDEQRAQKVEPQIILSMLVRQLHIIALVKSAPASKTKQDIATDSRLHPFVVQKAMESARALSLGTVRHFITELRDIDRTLKSKPINADEAIRSFIVTLAHADEQ